MQDAVDRGYFLILRAKVMQGYFDVGVKNSNRGNDRGKGRCKK